MSNISTSNSIGSNIRKFREKKKLTQKEFAALLGYKDHTAIVRIEKDASGLTYKKLENFARVLGVSVLELLGAEKLDEDTVRIPVLGRVAAGIPITAIEETIDWEEIPRSMANTGEFFGLKIKGDSMSPVIQDGYNVIIRKQSYADDGDIVIALVNGEDGICKKFKRTKDGIFLISLNPSYAPLFFTNKEIENLPISILGKVVELRGKL